MKLYIDGKEVVEEQTPSTPPDEHGNECSLSQSNGFPIRGYHTICVVNTKRCV